MTMLFAAAAVFLGIHLLIAGTRVRDALTGAFGEGLYLGLFSLASVAAIVWLVMAYNTAQAGGADRQAAPIVFCGEVSYSMYLLHLPILQLLVGEHAESAPANVAVAALVMSAASYASYRLFERPFIAVGRRVAERLVKLRIPTLVA